MDSIKYYSGGLPSNSHTPVYKMHKYFARRPHNVFQSIINHYTKPGDIIFDPFGGGGVTIIEGLTSNRRVLSCDVNPIASLVQYCQAAGISSAKFSEVADSISASVKDKFGESLTTACNECKEAAHVRWFEHAYLVDCPACKKEVDLSNDNLSKKADGKGIAGQYTCTHCKNSFKSANVIRKDSRILNIRYKCAACGNHSTKYPDPADVAKFEYFKKNKEALVRKLKLFIPEDNIPEYWDRQQEDCLHRKGILKFSDLFTPRNLLISAYFFECLEEVKKELDGDLYLFTLFTLSALLRYTNNMTFSTNSWMDGRPVAWAKHAYWLPNQFVEVNPLEYFQHRVSASLQGLKDRNARFGDKKGTVDETQFLSKEYDYCVVCKDSSHIDLPENSIDAIITDPPYGSNVQYSELSAFWYVWLKGKMPFYGDDLFFPSEAVVHRKTKHNRYGKSFVFYSEKLQEIFLKCYGVLKPGGYLVFTFNNKNIKAWVSVIKAAIDAGFYLEPEGIVYQEPIEAYRDTAHQRFDGTPQGDFVYSFKKTGYSIDFSKVPVTFDSCFEITVEAFFSKGKSFSTLEFLIRLYANSTFALIYRISNGDSESDVIADMSIQIIEQRLASDNRLINRNGKWEINK
jgi:putative DNA methylase